MTPLQIVRAGSSPRAWGIPVKKHPPCPPRRFIPTCVGNTAPVISRMSRKSVHPHVRGEYRKSGMASSRARGSSPRAWGIQHLGHGRLVYQRFIPTCVGNTWLADWLEIESPVHPHVRGEYTYTLDDAARKGGSSPRAWGIRMYWSNTLGRIRFIPTCVGNTWLADWLEIESPVHPHVRGEYERAAVIWLFVSGSSPRAWGIPSLLYGAACPDRFIPTCVGNTVHSCLICLMNSVHPHVRGEYGRGACRCFGGRGSSPRAWGIRRACWRARDSRRFIPTCVGNTKSC